MVKSIGGSEPSAVQRFSAFRRVRFGGFTDAIVTHRSVLGIYHVRFFYFTVTCIDIRDYEHVAPVLADYSTSLM